MLTKTKLALAATLILGSATVALAEDSSSSFAINTYAPAALQQQTLTTRPVALPRAQAPVVHEQYIDRASQVLDGGANEATESRSYFLATGPASQDAGLSFVRGSDLAFRGGRGRPP